MSPRSEPRITPGSVAHNRLQVEPAPDRRGRVAYLESYGGRGDLWLTDPVAGWPRQVTTEPHPAHVGGYAGGFFDWIPDGTGLIFVGADRGLWVVPDAGGPARPVTGLPGRCAAPAVSPDGGRLAFVYSTAERTDVVMADLGAGPVTEEELTVLNRSDFAFDPDWSPDGSLVAWHEWDVPSMPWDEGRIVVGGPDGSGRTVVDGEGYSVGQPRFSPDGRWVAYLSERTGWANLWMADTSTWTPRHLVDEPAEHGAPAWRPRVRTLAWSPEGDRLAFVRSRLGRDELWGVRVDGGEVSRMSPLEGRLTDLEWGARPMLVASASTAPRALVAVEEEGDPSVLADDGLAVWDALPPVPARPIVFPGHDGGAVHGFLREPNGGGPHPMLLHCHGGPNGQVKDDWQPEIQYWVERGWAVLSVNYRGSTGYGREYRDALLGRWGELDVSDAAAAVEWAVGEGIARREGVVAWGGSAGGYLVLMLLALHGGLLAGGINLFGVTDLEHLAEATHRFEGHYLDRLVGPLPEAADRYRARSPIALIDRIDRPLLTFQGERDEAVPAEQSRRIHEGLRARGVPSELVLYPDEGHGFARVETILDYLGRMEEFLERVVG